MYLQLVRDRFLGGFGSFWGGKGGAGELARDAVLSSWVGKQLAPWLDYAGDRQQYLDELNRLNQVDPGIAVYKFSGRSVDIFPKADGVKVDVWQRRSELYLSHFREVAALLSASLEMVIAVYLDDGVCRREGVPVFSFQKPRGNASILLPDVDFLIADFYRSSKYRDRIGFVKKTCSASFIGATSGSGFDLIRQENARLLDWPQRLASFAYFRGNSRVSFELPYIVQCDSQETVDILKAQGCGQGKRGARDCWQSAYSHRFIISMDGNGATCSRVVIALKSQCVLLKYDSDSVLYYFDGLEPWRHYIPISDDSDVEKILERDQAGVSFAKVAREGRRFAKSFLGKDAVLGYSCQLLKRFAADIFPRA